MIKVSLLESNYNATFANSALGILIALSIESFWTYTVVRVISKKYKRQDITRIDNTIDVDQKEKGAKNWTLWNAYI